MRVTDAWLIYILVVMGVFILLSLCTFKLHLDTITRLFIAMLVAAVVILIAIPNIIPASPGERTWYSVLLIIAFLGPLALAAWIVWVKNRNHFASLLGTTDGEGGDHKEFDCNGNECRLKTEVRQNGAVKEVYRYKS